MDLKKIAQATGGVLVTSEQKSKIPTALRGFKVLSDDLYIRELDRCSIKAQPARDKGYWYMTITTEGKSGRSIVNSEYDQENLTEFIKQAGKLNDLLMNFNNFDRGAV